MRTAAWIPADHNATTPCHPAAAAAMADALARHAAVPSARGHAAARAAQAELDAARAEVAALIGARAEEIVFTSGATEACNLAILGIAERLLPERPRFLAGATEHKAVLAPLARIAAAGGEAEIIPVDGEGRLAPPVVDARTALVAAMLVNNETGVVHDLPAVAAAAHAAGALVLCDATQAPGRWPIDIAALGCDLLSLSAHKLYGPPGVGCLWIRRGLGLAAQIHGGSQERGLRAGTPNLPAIVGFAVAARLARSELAERRAHLAAGTARLEARLRAGLPDIVIHGAGAVRAPGTTMITRPGQRRGWLAGLGRTLASGGAACSAGEPSHVLIAMGATPAEAANAIRIGLGRTATDDEVDAIAADVIAAAG